MVEIRGSDFIIGEDPYPHGGFHADVVSLDSDIYFRIFMTACNAVPTVSEWGVILMASIVAMLGILAIRGRRFC